MSQELWRQLRIRVPIVPYACSFGSGQGDLAPGGLAQMSSQLERTREEREQDDEVSAFGSMRPDPSRPQVGDGHTYVSIYICFIAPGRRLPALGAEHRALYLQARSNRSRIIRLRHAHAIRRRLTVSLQILQLSQIPAVDRPRSSHVLVSRSILALRESRAISTFKDVLLM